MSLNSQTKHVEAGRKPNPPKQESRRGSKARPICGNDKDLIDVLNEELVVKYPNVPARRR